MKISEFQKISMQEIQTMTTPEIKKLVQEGAKKLNPRINRLYRAGAEKKKIAADAYEAIEQGGGLFTTARNFPREVNGTITYEKTRNELISELKREIEFSKMKTSTVTGAKEVLRERAKDARAKYEESGYSWDELTPKEQNGIISDYWDDYHKWAESHQFVKYSERYGLYATQNAIPGSLEAKVNEYSQRQEAEYQKAYEQAEHETNYRPKWQF